MTSAVAGGCCAVNSFLCYVPSGLPESGASKLYMLELTCNPASGIQTVAYYCTAWKLFILPCSTLG